MIKSQVDISAFTGLFGDALDSEEIQIDIIVSNRKNVLYCDRSFKYTDEKFILEINYDNGICFVKVECSGEKSAFYALCEIVLRSSSGALNSGKFECSPSFSTRGYIEGFYGKPWGHQQRISFMSLMAENRMNTVYYAPKDDEYHRKKWRDKYPDAELSLLKDLSDTAKKYHMNFYWCVAPGLSITYSDENDFNTLIDKTKQLYFSADIKCFGLLLDDINEELNNNNDRSIFGETVNAHIDLINKYYNELIKLDPQIKLTVCPTLYHGSGNEYYISKLGKNISPLISVFWTGRDICSRDIFSHEAISFTENTYHKPLYWDNYPVNDMAMHYEMHLSPVINRDADLWKYSEGIIANCMEYAECSKIPLITFADYLWDSENYDPGASWRKAVCRVTGKEKAGCFIIFADHLFTSCLKDENSKIMKELLFSVVKLISENEIEKAKKIAKDYIGKMNECREYLNKDIPICKELKKWSEKFIIASDIISGILDFIITGDDNIKNSIIALIQKYNSMPEKLIEDSDFYEALDRYSMF